MAYSRLGILVLDASKTAALMKAVATVVKALLLRIAAHVASVKRSPTPGLLAIAGFRVALGAWPLRMARSTLTAKPKNTIRSPMPEKVRLA